MITATDPETAQSSWGLRYYGPICHWYCHQRHSPRNLAGVTPPVPQITDLLISVLTVDPDVTPAPFSRQSSPSSDLVGGMLDHVLTQAL